MLLPENISSHFSSSTEIQLAAVMLELLQARGRSKTICPSEAARAWSERYGSSTEEDWREKMPMAREVALQLEELGYLRVCQRGRHVKPPFRGPIRLRWTGELP